MPKREDIHACWSLNPQFDKATGNMTTEGLFALGGHSGDGALRELKKRCDVELEHAGKPLVGCAMYVNIVMSWVGAVLFHEERLKGTEIMINNAADKSFRQGFERSFRLTGEDKIADLIEETWVKYQKEKHIPDAVRMDIEEEIKEILENKYGDVGLEPHNFSPAEIDLSKTLALGLGRKKMRKPAVEPAPEETPEEHEPVDEPAPETKPPGKTKTEIKDEIKSRMQRA